MLVETFYIVPADGKQKNPRKKLVAKFSCDICSEEFQSSNSIKKKIKRNNHFCSKFCFGESLRNSGHLRRQIEDTNLKKYGVKNPASLKETKEKIENTRLKKYGVKHLMQSQEFLDKRVKTYIKNLGVDNPSKSKEVQDKKVMTSIKNHGATHPHMSKKIQEKYKKTCRERFGVDNPLSNNRVREKCKETLVKRYGVEFSLQSDEIIEKFYKTKFGISRSDYIAQLPEFENYKREVSKITNQQPIHLLENSNKNRGKGEDDYQLDHMFSKREGFLQDIDSEIIGNICNLEFIPARENISKGKDCSISKEELIKRFNESDKE